MAPVIKMNHSKNESLAGISRSISFKKDATSSLQRKTASLRKLIVNQDEDSDQSSISSLDIAASRGPSQQQDTTNRRNSRKQVTPKMRTDRAFQELIELKSSMNLLITRLAFQRLVREVLDQFHLDFRMQAATFECLRESSEFYLVGLFEDAYLCCMHRQNPTITVKDIRFALSFRGPISPGASLQNDTTNQSSTKPLIPKLPFKRLVREVLQQFRQDFRMQTDAVECLQEASETYLIEFFKDAYLCCRHRERVTLNEKDMQFARIIRGETNSMET